MPRNSTSSPAILTSEIKSAQRINLEVQNSLGLTYKPIEVRMTYLSNKRNQKTNLFFNYLSFEF